MPRKKLSIVFTAAECAPFAKVGGLGDVIGSLPQALAERGCTVTVIIPLYGSIDRTRYRLTKFGALTFEHNKRTERCVVWRAQLRGNPVTYLFIEHPLFKAKEIYRAGSVVTSGIDPDIDKFGFYSKAAVEAIQQLPVAADIIHCHDWHAGLVPTFVDQLAVTKNYPFTKTVYTIHNLGNQGITPRSEIRRLTLALSEPAVLEDYYDLDEEKLNLMKIGILTADRISTVSETYAKEILTPEYGGGLESFLSRRKKDLSGIVNGIDTKLFDPAKDAFLIKRYSLKTWKQGKQKNKQAVQRSLGLPRSGAPLYGLVSRLVAQKGLDILVQSLETFLRNDVQVAILGTGEKKLELQLVELAKRFPEKLHATIGFDLRQAQQIYAGSDVFLMPSRFEPCGLGQLIAMRYGTLPLVRATGGLQDTVQHLRTGIVFSEYSAQKLSTALEQSLALYGKPKSWYTMVERCMKQDFSWASSAKKYIALYRRLI